VVEVTSSAANADIFLGGSESIRVTAFSSGHRQVKTGLHVLRGLQAMLGQREEFRRLCFDDEKGEEAVLIGEKQQD
jgi:hypothetical protein